MKHIAALLLGAALSGASIQFSDVAPQAGLTDAFFCGSDEKKEYIIETLGGGVALFDYDKDGYLDAFFVTGSRLEGFSSSEEPTNQLYQNNHDGTFSKVTQQAGLAYGGWGQGVCAGDFDNDGFVDLFVTYFGQNHLYRNTGKSKFADVTRQVGLAASKRWSTGCAFVDYDLDGHLDLFVANYLVFDKTEISPAGSSPDCQWKGQPVMCGPRGLPGETNQLFRNLGNGRFDDVSESSGVSSVKDRYSLSVTTLDYNEDGWPDIYVAVDAQPSILFRNNRDGTLKDVAVPVNVALSEDGRKQAGMGSAAGDFDGDGHLDLAKTNFIEDTANLYRNNGDESFEDRVYRAGMGKNVQFMGWGVGFFDADNDSWPDLFMVNGHVYPEIEKIVPGNPYKQRRILYHNVGGAQYDDISASAGDGVTTPHSSRGLAFGDFDNDGDVDLFINNMNETPSLLRNEGTSLGGFLSVKLAGRKSNRDGIGAWVTVYAGERKMVQEVRSGSSFMSHSDRRLHFGLGEAELVEKIEIRWPARQSTVETITSVQPNQFVTITEGLGVTDRNVFKQTD